MYGNHVSLAILECANLKVQNQYALTKNWSEDACELFSNNFKIAITFIRPFNFYGPRQPSIFLLEHIISQLRNNDEIRVKDLEPRRDYVYVKDLINAILKTVETDLDFEFFNVGFGESYSVGDIITFAQKLYNSQLPVSSEDTSRKVEIMNTIVDKSKAKKILNWSPEWDIIKS